MCNFTSIHTQRHIATNVLGMLFLTVERRIDLGLCRDVDAMADPAEPPCVDVDDPEQLSAALLSSYGNTLQLLYRECPIVAQFVEWQLWKLLEWKGSRTALYTAMGCFGSPPQFIGMADDDGCPMPCAQEWNPLWNLCAAAPMGESVNENANEVESDAESENVNEVVEEKMMMMAEEEEDDEDVDILDVD